MTRLSIAILPLLFAAPAMAQVAPGLPERAVHEAIEVHPRTQAAQAKVEAARQQAGALRAGPYEFTVTGDIARRSVQGDGQFNDYSVTVERPIRLPGKGALDRKAGSLGIEVAELQADDVRHQLALQLNTLWWDWVAAEAEVRILTETQQTLQQAYRGVELQVKAGDAAQVDADRAMAEVSTNKAALGAAQSRASVARGRLEAQFPGLALPVAAPALAVPGMPLDRIARLRDAVVTCNHELPAALAEADRLAALSERSRRDRLGDPTIGARVFSERGGMEKGAGLVVTVPLGGRYRAAVSSEAAAAAQAAASTAASARLDVQEMATTGYSEALGAAQTWQASGAALASSTRAAQRLRSGYRLGHVDLADLLYAERQAKDAALAETLARAAALRAEAKLRIDAHDLWLKCSHHQEHAHDS